MSDTFSIVPVTSAELAAYRMNTGAGLDEAKLTLARDRIEEAIHRAQDVEDLKVCLLAILHNRPRHG